MKKNKEKVVCCNGLIIDDEYRESIKKEEEIIRVPYSGITLCPFLMQSYTDPADHQKENGDRAGGEINIVGEFECMHCDRYRGAFDEYPNWGVVFCKEIEEKKK